MRELDLFVPQITFSEQGSQVGEKQRPDQERQNSVTRMYRKIEISPFGSPIPLEQAENIEENARIEKQSQCQQKHDIKIENACFPGSRPKRPQINSQQLVLQKYRIRILDLRNPKQNALERIDQQENQLDERKTGNAELSHSENR